MPSRRDPSLGCRGYGICRPQGIVYDGVTYYDSHFAMTDCVHGYVARHHVGFNGDSGTCRTGSKDGNRSVCCPLTRGSSPQGRPCCCSGTLAAAAKHYVNRQFVEHWLVNTLLLPVLRKGHSPEPAGLHAAAEHQLWPTCFSTFTRSSAPRAPWSMRAFPPTSTPAGVSRRGHERMPQHYRQLRRGGVSRGPPSGCAHLRFPVQRWGV